MIPLKINGEKYKVPSYDELTVKQLLSVKKAVNEKEEKEQLFTIIDYISIFTGIEYKIISKTKFKDLDHIIRFIGEERDYTKMNPKKKLILSNQQVINISDCKIETFGQRIMIELNTKGLYFEDAICFILATSIVKDTEGKEVNRLREQFLDMNYLEILPTAFFLLIYSGLIRRKELKNLRKSTKAMNSNSTGKPQELKD